MFFIKVVSEDAQSSTRDAGGVRIMWPTINIKHLVGTQHG